MKTIKLMIIATLLTFSAVSVTNADGFRTRPKVKQAHYVTIQQAVQDPGLVVAMHEQVSPNILYFYLGPTLTVDVNYLKIVYRISGSRGEWVNFFHGPTIKKYSSPQN
jgi:hypothetical protein